MTGQTALILGATGATGKHLLRELLASPHFTSVGEFGRRVTGPEQLAGVPGVEKLVQKTVDFEDIEKGGLKDQKWDVIFITMGTNRKQAGSAEAFVKIDREYVINAARAARGQHPQRMVYMSSIGANSSSPFLYPQSKGLTEEGLAGLGYNETIVFRPAFLKNAERTVPRIGETIFGYVTSALALVSSNAEIPVQSVAKAMRNAGILGVDRLPAVAEASKTGKDGHPYTVIANKGTAALADYII